MRGLASAVVVGLVATVGAIIPSVLGAVPSCPTLSADRGPLGFQRRSNGDRCEGFFRSNVAGEALSVAFLMAGRFPPTANVVEVSAAVPRREPFNVRAVALPLGTYYRMDAAVGPNAPLRWPLSEVVGASGSLRVTDLGLYGWFGEAARPTYVPVRAVASGAPAATVAVAAATTGDQAVRLGVRANVPLALLVYNIADDHGCHFGGRSWTQLGVNVRAGAVLSIPRVADGPAPCVGFRAKLTDSDQTEPLTIKIQLR